MTPDHKKLMLELYWAKANAARLLADQIEQKGVEGCEKTVIAYKTEADTWEAAAKFLLLV